MRRPDPAPLARPLALCALLALAPSLIAGCAAVGELAKAAFQKPTLTFVKVDVQALDFEGATLALDYRLENPNGFGLRLARVQAWGQLEGKVVARAEVPGGLSIPAGGTAPVRFAVRLPWADVPRLLELVERQQPVAYTVGGKVGVETPIGVIDLPIEHSGTVALPALPDVRLARASARLASLTDVEVDLTLVVHNPNPFPLPEGQLRYAFALGGEVVATSDLEGLTAAGAHGESRVTIPLKLSLLGAGRAAAAALKGGAVEVRLTGEAKAGSVPVPFDVSGRLGR